MKALYEQHRIRYPPFEAARWQADALPVATQRLLIGHYESAEEAIHALDRHGPEFRMGGERDWLMERTFVYDDQPLGLEVARATLEDRPYVRLVERQRRGWYLIPNPIHNILRSFINGVVIVLLICLFYLFISPVLLALNIPVYGLETVRWGLLDYPALAVVVVPLIFAPLILRVAANLIELRRQNLFLKRNLTPPSIEFRRPSVANESLELSVSFPEWDKDWNHVDAILRVGVLPPSREVLFDTLDRDPNRQPPPGLSTELPHHWEVGLDDGTAGGEDAPMELKEVRGGLYLRPMRIMAQGEPMRWTKGEPIKLQPPDPVWPGSVHSDLLRIHWECILRIDRKKGGALLWVQPLMVAHATERVALTTLPLHDGRSELDMT